MQGGQMGAAYFILQLNTELFPKSANTWDSFAESLLANKKPEKAYRKAVELAKTSDGPNLELFKENLKKAEAALVRKP